MLELDKSNNKILTNYFVTHTITQKRIITECMILYRTTSKLPAIDIIQKSTLKYNLLTFCEYILTKFYFLFTGKERQEQ